jgi:hypothetical protein
MSPFPPEPQKSCTPQEVDAWLRAAEERRAQLHIHAASPLKSDEWQAAFTAMSVLLLEAFEEVRVVSESTRERSQAARADATDLRTHSARLMAQCAKTMARTAQSAPPSPEALREAESRLLALFKDTER